MTDPYGLPAWISAQCDQDDALLVDARVHRSMPTEWIDRLEAEVDAKRQIIAEHAVEWQAVEWPHDQDGKGNAQVCRRCQNAEHTEWNPPDGEAGTLPAGFVASYVLAPCPTLRQAALPLAGRKGYREEWRPE